jgi:hypothetical protein
MTRTQRPGVVQTVDLLYFGQADPIGLEQPQNGASPRLPPDRFWYVVWLTRQPGSLGGATRSGWTPRPALHVECRGPR